MNKAIKFRAKPIFVEAIKFDGSNYKECKLDSRHVMGEFCWGIAVDQNDSDIFLEARPGDWIVTGIRGQRYPVKLDIFEATYEKIDSESGDTTARQS